MRFRYYLLFVLIAGLSVAAYVGVSALGSPAGFPLDDAWIHQTYARSFATTGQFAFAPGQPSAGSTSPLWTLLIAVGYRLNVDYRLWTYTLGALSLALCAWLASRLSLRLWPDRRGLAGAVGLLCLFEWHLVWAAASGMETVLFAALALAVMERTARPGLRRRDGLMSGVLGGLLTATRPEGLLLVALAGVVAMARRATGDTRHSEPCPEPFAFAQGKLRRRGSEESAFRAGEMLRCPFAALRASAQHDRRARFMLALCAGFAVSVLPAAWLNLRASGTPFPNTFYAKQQEYAVYFSSLAAWLPRAIEVLGAPFVGAQFLLLPGFLAEALASLRRLRDRSTWVDMLPIAWVAAHLGVYLLRLPVAYQHGRYMIPVIPIVILYGVHGTARILERLKPRFRSDDSLAPVAQRSGVSRPNKPATQVATTNPFRDLLRLARPMWTGSVIAATAAFWLVGAGAYRVDVNIIENELVASARWIEANTPPGALVAAHDIGAIGYFSRRPLLDLAGLISPEVIPILRDEEALLALLRMREADFVAAPPNFYSPALLDAPELEPAFSGDSPFTPKHWLIFRARWGRP